MKQRILILSITLAITIVASWLAICFVPLPERLGVADSTVVEWSSGEPAHVFLAPDGRWRLTTRLEHVDPRYRDALIAYEDKRFYTHHGVDVRAVLRAAGSNLRRGRVVSGASTLTMQLVRMVEPRPRTFRSKLIEAFRAIQLEYHMNKDEILAAYLRFLPFGRNVEGLETAAWVYFGHDASALAPHEIATLLAVPQSPTRRYPNPENRARLTAARDAIARELLEAGNLGRGANPGGLTPAQAMRQVQAHTAPGTMQALPRAIPHFAIWLRQRYPRAARLRTTIDPAAQRSAEQMMQAHRARVAHLGAHNAAVVVVDHTSGALRAVVGNFDFHDKRHAGQLPGFATRRSSGSLLKPFLMAHAIDRGLALPSHLVADVPVDYAGYAPQNYSEQFRGLVRLDEALQSSLNIPFVQLLDRVGVEAFLNLLRRLGLGDLDPRAGHYGLSVAVGGVEASPMDMAGLYSALARRGAPAPIYFLEPPAVADGAGAPPREVFAPDAGGLSRGAATLVGDILSERPRPDRPTLGQRLSPRRRYAWKTGTSMGLRDAWTAGFGQKYTTVVWTGNFNNHTQTGIVGSQAAAPLFFDIMEALDPGFSPTAAAYTAPGTVPSGLVGVEVCAYSGHLPTSACTHTRMVERPANSLPSGPCPYHQPRDIDVATGESLNLACRQSRAFETRSYVIWPDAVREVMRQQGYQMPQAPPPFAPGCSPAGMDTAPRIISPAANTLIELPSNVPSEDQPIPLIAQAPDGEASIDWFVDGKFVGTGRAGRPLWFIPAPGTHEILAVDARGQTARAQLLVNGR